MKKNGKPALVTHTMKSEAADRGPSEHSQPRWPPASERARHQQLCAHEEQVLWAGGPDTARGPGVDANKCPVSSRHPLLEKPHHHLKSPGDPRDPQIVFSSQDLSLGLELLIQLLKAPLCP